jgi:glycosyltransferase involved in cell wall biosynthesis
MAGFDDPKRGGEFEQAALSQIPWREDRTLAVISTFPPTRCGLATYAEDLITALRAARADLRVLSVRVAASAKDLGPAELTVKRADVDAWRAAACFLSAHRVGVAILEHEFKIFGGAYGSNILKLTEQHPCAIVTTLHTVSRQLRGPRLNVLRQLCAASDRIVVHTLESKILLHCLGVDGTKIHVIPHGVPIVPFKWPKEIGQPAPHVRPLFLSFGHLRRSKGYGLAIEALARIRDDGIAFEYWIYGKDHPRRKSAATYRAELMARVHELALQNQIRFVDAYLTVQELANVVRACDVGILPYTRIEQASSGTLPFFLACGRPVVASAFRAAREMVDSRCGKLFPVGNRHCLYKALKQMASAAELRAEMMLQAHARAEAWRWDLVGKRYLEVIDAAQRRCA